MIKYFILGLIGSIGLLWLFLSFYGYPVIGESDFSHSHRIIKVSKLGFFGCEIYSESKSFFNHGKVCADAEIDRFYIIMTTWKGNFFHAALICYDQNCNRIVSGITHQGAYASS